jgi:drug/metabolite transporter (DMT)-like permease
MAPSGSRDLLGGAFVGVAAVMFGGVVTLGKLVTDLPVAALLAFRFGIAALSLALVLAVRRQPIRPAPGEWLPLVALGGIGYAVESAFFFLALGRGTAATVTLLFYTYPVIVTVLSAILGMGLPGLLVGGSLVAAVAGTAVVITSSGGLDISGPGIAFSLASAGTFSLYLLAVDAVLRRTSSLVAAMWVSLSAAAALGAVAPAAGGRLPAGTEWLSVTGMGILTGGAFVLLFLGLRRVGAVRTAIIASLEPVATALLALWFLAEPIRPGVAVGGLLILAGAVTASLARRVPEPEAGVP